jgi:hypothetical protein
MLAKEWLHCTVDEARDRLSYEEVISHGWFLMELRKAENGDKQAFKPSAQDIFAYYQKHPEELQEP